MVTFGPLFKTVIMFLIADKDFANDPLTVGLYILAGSIALIIFIKNL